MVIITSNPKASCDLCGGSGTLVQSGIGDPDAQLEGAWSFRRCDNPQCGVCWLDPAPPPEELWKAYTTYHTHSRRTQRFSAATLSVVHRLLKLCLAPIWISNGLQREASALRYMTLAHEPAGKLLDVGCGGGRFLRRMQKRGWQVEGTDFDEQAARKVTVHYGIQTHVGDLAQCALPGDHFDVVTLSQTIEHLYDPRSTLRECLRILKPGGLLVLTTPNERSLGAAEFGAYWRGWEAPRHLHLFAVDSLRRLTQQSGFDIELATTYSAGSAIVYRVSRALREGTPRSWLDGMRALLWSYRKELHEQRAQALTPHTGQNILLRARKPHQ